MVGQTRQRRAHPAPGTVQTAATTIDPDRTAEVRQEPRGGVDLDALADELQTIADRNAAPLVIDLGLGYSAVWTTAPNGVRRPVIVDDRIRHLGETDSLVLAALTAVADRDGVPASAWRDTAAVPDRTFYRSRARLIARRMVVNIGTERRPRYAPTPLALTALHGTG